jgi:hypothetical protein
MAMPIHQTGKTNTIRDGHCSVPDCSDPYAAGAGRATGQPARPDCLASAEKLSYRIPQLGKHEFEADRALKIPYNGSHTERS